MKDRFYYFINGILTDDDDVNTWNSCAESWIESKTPFKADAYKYTAGAITRRFGQNGRVDDVASVIARVDLPVYLVGHSNGCDIIERYVKKHTRRIEELHLIGAASEADFRKNGYTDALRSNRVGRIFVYWSKNDDVLKGAKWSTALLGRFGLGYGYLGLVGPRYVPGSFSERVHSLEFKYGHSEYFKDHIFNETMRSILGAPQ